MKVELYVVSVKPKTKYSKSLRLQDVDVNLMKFSKNYEKFLEPALSYFSKNLKVLATRLSVVKIMPKGNHIMGIFGGEKKKGKEVYAGLVLEEMNSVNGKIVEFKLVNMNKKLRDNEDEFKKHLYILIYGGEIFPFYLNRVYNFLFAKEREELKKYLTRLFNLNKNELGDNANLLKKLIDEVEASGEPLIRDNWYVLYRRMRAFAALSFKPDNNMYVAPDEVSIIHVGRDEEAEQKAYYYASMLNYIIRKGNKLGITFSRGQFARPLYALAELGLSWNETNASVVINDRSVNVKTRVTELSRKLHELAPRMLKDKVTKGTKVSIAFDFLENDSVVGSLLKELMQIIDTYLEKYKGLKDDDIKDILASWI